GAGRTSDGNGSHASTLKSPSYTKSVSWQHYQKMLSGKKEAGVSREQKVKLINFNCEKLQSSRIALYSN
ncbi:hypothetical protein C5Y91_14710, partial [Escherichia coli]|uniref:DUF1187 family protein n=1 Tax=Escherichia coli TaxID=562 RepID=UPI000CF3A5AC